MTQERSIRTVLSDVGHLTEDTEFYTSMPPGYQKGQTKYVAIFGTVMSGLGKGIFASSLAKVLQDKGLAVAPIKLEGYLNRDSGTLNPYRHGEVFVLDDGMECDMDLGTYERLLDQDLTRINFCTSGQILGRVLEKERKGDYLGRDVQMIPHVTGEVEYCLRELAVASGADVIFIEIGGTVGDVENAYLIEAIREMAYEEGPQQFCFVALTYVIEPPALGEQKSKPAQINLKLLNAAGIHPHIIACRAQNPVSYKVREKLSLYANVPIERVFSMHDCDSIYVVPEMLRGAGIDSAVMEVLHLETRDPVQEEKSRKVWQSYIHRYRHARNAITLGVIGKYTTVRDSYASIIHAVEHAGTAMDAKVQLAWVDSTTLTRDSIPKALEHVHGIIVPGGFGHRGVDGKIDCIGFARRNGLPYLGLCYGMQIAVIEYARNVLNLPHANTTEIDRDCADPVIDVLPDQLRIQGMGGSMRLGGQDVMIMPDSLIWRLCHHQDRLRLRFRHRYEVNPAYIERFEKAGLVFSGKAPDQPIMQILELPEKIHPFFLATQAHPELTSRPLRPSPFFLGLIHASLRRSGVEAIALPEPGALTPNAI